MDDAQKDLRSSYNWKALPQHREAVILDPDGWNRTSEAALHASMSELITEAEFIRRMQRSTSMLGMQKDSAFTPFLDADGREVSDLAVRRLLKQMEAWAGISIAASQPAARELVAKFHSNDIRDILMVQSDSPAVKVEWDGQFTGGDYNGVGAFAFIPAVLIEQHGGSVEESFRIFMQRDPVHIVHYESDATYTMLGEEIDDTIADSPAPKG